MKTKFILLGLSLFVLTTVKAQYPDDSYHLTTTFEDDWSFIEFDPPENNIWQVGTPSKVLLDTASSGTLALMTDTSQLISEPFEHSFIIKGHRAPWFNSCNDWVISMYTKYQFDDFYSGGYFEVSYDEGQTWTNIVKDDTLYNVVYINHFYNHRDTLINGINGFSGIEHDYSKHQICVYFPCYYTSAALIYSVWVKVTYVNLGVNNPHEGWLIDNLYFDIIDCEWLESETSTEEIDIQNNLVLFPNPAQKELAINLPTNYGNKYKLVIYNTKGQMVLHSQIMNNNEPINVSHLPKGMYVCAIKSNNGVLRAKFIKE